MPDFKNLDAVVETDPLKKLDGIVANPVAKTSFIGNPYAQSVGRIEANGWENKLNAASVASTANPYIFVTNDVLKANQRYPDYNPTVKEPEDYFAYGQSNWDKAANGLLKGVNLAGTTFIQGTAGLLYGIGAAAGNWKISSLYNNDFSNALQDWNAASENVLPNYQTNVERDAKWYQADNWFKANFLWDSVVKNLGFSVGAIYSGAVVAKALNLVPALFNISKAGILADVAATGEKAINAVPATERLNIFSSAIRKASESTLTASKLLSPIDRTLVSFLGAVTEGGIEAQQGLNEYRNTLIQQYTDEHGEAPTGGVLDAINQKSAQLGNARFALNLLLLSATNYIQLPKILGASYKAEKNIANSLYESINPIARNAETGLLSSALPTKTFPKLLYKAANIGGLFFSPSEAFEEGAQYAIEKGTQAYYNKKNNSDGFLDNFVEAAKVGISKTFSEKEGLESILIGGLSGGLQQAGFVGRSSEGKIGLLKGGEIEKRGFTGYGGEKAKNTAEFISKANAYKLNFKSDAFLSDTVDAAKRATTLQQEGEEAVRQGDVLETKDNEFDYQHNYLTPRIKYGRYDLVKQDVESYRQAASTKEGFEALQAKGIANQIDTQQTFLQRLTNFERHADNVNSLYQSLNLRYSGFVHPDTKERVYSDDVIDKMVYASSKVADYDQRIPELSQQLSLSGINVPSLLSSIVGADTNISAEDTKKALSDIDSLNIISEKKDELKLALHDVIEMTLRRKEFLNEYDVIKKHPSQYEEKAPAPATSTSTAPSTITIKTKDGEENIEVGTEYFLGKVSGTSKEGKEFIRYPRITIIGENEDGTIKIKASNGNVKDISKEELADYKLGKVSDTLNNKKAKFFMDNVNTIFAYKVGKGKPPIIGRLEYTSKKDTLLFIHKNGEIEVRNTQFKPKKGFKEALITPIGKLTPQQNKSLQDFIEDKDEEARNNNLKILSQLFDSLSKRSTEATTLIKQKTAELDNIEKELQTLSDRIASGELTKKNNFKATTNRAIKAANRLSRMKEQLSNEIEQLNSELDELQMTEAYVADMAQNIDELPTDSAEFLEELKDQTSALENLILETGSNVNSLSKIIDGVSKALDTAMDFINNLLSIFSSTYPKVPTDTRGQEWKDFLKANPNFLKLNPKYREDLATVEDLVAQVEDLDVIPNERTLNELRGELSTLNNQLKEYENELKIKSTILDKFQSIADEYKKQQAESQALQKNQELLKQVFATHDTSQNSLPSTSSSFENVGKKSAANMFASTRTFSPQFSQGPEKPHHKRSNYFGNRWLSLKDKEAYRIVLVHEGMGAAYTPLISAVKGDYVEKGADDRLLLAVVVKEDDNGYHYINQEGDVIAKLGDDISGSINELVFQAMPGVTDKWRDNASAKRSNESQELLNANLDIYRKQREKFFSQNSPQSFFEFVPSFGLPVKESLNGPNKFISDTPHPISNIIPEGEIHIELSTTSDLQVTNGLQQATILLGQPALVTDNAIIPLNNRKLTSKEQSTIFKIIKKLSEFAQQGTIKENDIAINLFSYLKGVVYWGIPKNDAGRNSIWFAKNQQEDYVLHIGNNNATIPFTPFYLSSKEGEAQLKLLLSEMYNNVNINKLKSGEEFREIADINEDGTPSAQKVWPSYTSYLTSMEGRSPSELPLSTTIPAFITDNQQTREGIYYNLIALQDEYLKELPQQQPQKQEKFKEAVKEASQTSSASSSREKRIAANLAELERIANLVVGKEGGSALKDKKADIERRRQEELPIINVYWGSAETPNNTRVLSNLAPRKFTYNGKEYGSVEHAYQTLKSGEFDQSTYDKYVKAGGYGTKIKGKAVNKSFDNLQLMKDLVVQSFKQNPEQAKLLLKYKDFTHTTNEIIDKAFLEGLKLAKYNAELTALEESEGVSGSALGDKKDATPKAEFEVGMVDFMKFMSATPPPSSRETRLVTSKDVTTEDWKKVEKWLSKNFPSLPVYRVKNLIQVAKDTYAWGLYADGALYLYENAEIGTAFHEVFHGIMDKFTTPEEKLDILKEFNDRKGNFTTRQGASISHSSATWKQAEEQLAEEFRNYVIKPFSILSKIGQLFKDLYNFIFGIKNNNIQQLFKDINGGKYRTYLPLNSLSFAEKGIMNVNYISTSEFNTFETSLAPNQQLTAIQEKDMLEHLTSRAFDYLFLEEKNLFSINKVKEKEFYNYLFKETIGWDAEKNTFQGDGGLIAGPVARLNQSLKEGTITQEEFNAAYMPLNDLYTRILENWEAIKDRHKLYMKTFNIEWDENDELVSTDENKTGRETGQNAMQVDHIRKANSAIKLLFATIKETTFDTPQAEEALSNTKIASSSIGGDKLQSFGKGFIETLNNVADSPTFDVMMDNLIKQASILPNYVRLFTRLKGNRQSGKIKWDQLSIPDLQLLITFFRTFSKQSPIVLNHYIGEDGRAYIGSGNIASATEQLKETYEQGIIKAVKNIPLFSKVSTKTTRGYVVNKPELVKYNLRTNEGALKFLKALNIEINFNSLSLSEKKIVKDAISGVYTAFNKAADNKSVIVTLNNKIFDISGSITKIAESQVKLTLGGNDSVFYNIDGQLQQTYVEKNYPSHFADVINNVKNKKELSNTNFSYLLNDVFSSNSLILKHLFNEEGKRQNKIKIGYVNGTIDDRKGRRTTTDRLSRGSRLLQQINLNLSEWYYTLIPSDSSTEWMMNIKNNISYSSIRNNDDNKLHSIFQGYLKDEIALAQEGREDSLAMKSRTKELRFFKEILPSALATKLIAGEDMEQHLPEINKSIDEFIASLSNSLKQELLDYKLVDINEKGFYNFISLDTSNLSEFNADSFNENSLAHLTKYLASNYAIANIEMFKTIFGDPYEYKDLIKRIKSFLSPAETTINSSPEINQTLSKLYNSPLLSPTDIGWRAFKEYVNTAALADVMVSTEDYSEFAEPDAQGLISDDADREFKLKSSLWNDQYEQQYQYDKAWERNYKANNSTYVYSSTELKEADDELLAKGNPHYKAYYITKPIVRGNKYNSPDNNVMIDKFSLSPISFRAIMEFNPNSNMMELYNKMKKEGIDYLIFESGRKVGNEFSNPAYNKEGKISTAKFKGIVKVAFENFSIQVQTQPKEQNKQTLGSQLSKLATLDMMEAGVPIDYMPKLEKNKRFNEWLKLKDKTSYNEGKNIYKEIIHNQEVLEAMMTEGYQSLLNKLGIKEANGSFSIADRDKAAKMLQDEIFKRDVNDNIIKALDYFAKGEIALESTPLYQQFKNILYSIVDKNITSPKLSGGPKVQMASTFFENKREFSEHKDKNGKKYYASTDLKFYEDEDGKRHIEIYLSSDYIRKQIPLKHPLNNLTDKELYAALTSDVLTGIGFRIPSQNTNSSDVFVIKQFLPVEMGDTIVVPSALVKKSGSDFDIDKLNTYLKNIYITNDNKIKVIPFQGTGPKALDLIKEWLIKNEITTTWNAPKDVLQDFDAEAAELEDEEEIASIYKKSLQNEYYSSLQALISHPLNYQKLISPNDASLLKGISNEIASLKNLPSEDATPKQLLSMSYMNEMRHNFLAGKDVVGIGAVGQTNHANNQRAPIYVDPSKLTKMEDTLKEWLGDGSIHLPHNTRQVDGKTVASLSEIYTTDKKRISDINSMLIDGGVDISKGAWIVRLLGNIKAFSTFQFLTKIGVSPATTAYFINQPIVQSYLKKIDQKGYNWLFIGDFVQELFDGEFNTPSPTPSSINISTLKSNIGNNKLSDVQKAEQKFILLEFLKYAKMAQHLFYVTQGTNYDTANINDPYILFKKSVQLEKARNTIISSPDKILDSSFIGNTRQLLISSRNALSTILPTDEGRIRNILEQTLIRFTDLPDRQFVQTSKAVVQSFLDYLIQTHYRLNTRIEQLMVGDKNIPQQLHTIINSLSKDDELHTNPVISSILTLKAQKEGATNNLKIKTKNIESYQQDTLIKAFQELKYNPITSAIYPGIIRTSLLQGLANSPISFTQFIPVEDLVNVLQPIFNQLAGVPDIENFSTLHMFERNNWNNTDVVPSQYVFDKGGVLKIYNRIKNIPEKFKQNGVSKIIAINTLSRTSDNDIITISYKKQNDSEGKPYTAERIAQMKKNGDYSYIYKGLFQRVYNGTEPLIHSQNPFQDAQGNTIAPKNYVFKLINAWGSSYRLQEYYNTTQPSVIDNGYEKTTELTDSEIVQQISGTFVQNNMEQKSKSIVNHNMYYKMPAKENLTGKDTSTLELAEKGLRTATTRSYALGKVGDIITFEGKPQKYRITNVEQLTKEKAENTEWVKQWSQKEQWTTEHFKNALGGKTVHIGSYQTSFEKIENSAFNDFKASLSRKNC